MKTSRQGFHYRPKERLHKLLTICRLTQRDPRNLIDHMIDVTFAGIEEQARAASKSQMAGDTSAADATHSTNSGSDQQPQSTTEVDSDMASARTDTGGTSEGGDSGARTVSSTGQS